MKPNKKEGFDFREDFAVAFSPNFQTVQKQMQKMNDFSLRKLAHLLALWQYEVSLELRKRDAAQDENLV